VITLLLLRTPTPATRALAGRRRAPPAVRQGPTPVGAAGRLLAATGEAPDLFVTSPRVRAAQTAEIVAAPWGPRGRGRPLAAPWT